MAPGGQGLQVSLALLLKEKVSLQWHTEQATGQGLRGQSDPQGAMGTATHSHCHMHCAHEAVYCTLQPNMMV
jgi:hypothetical protein